MIRDISAKLSVLAAALALFLSSFVSDAQAFVVSLGTLEVPGTTTVGAALGPSEDLPVAFTFQVDSPASIDSVLVTVDAGNFAIDNFNLALFEGTPNADGTQGAASNVGATVTSLVNAGGVEVVELVFSGLNALTTYFLQVQGNVTGSSGGSFSGTITVVPLPPAVLLFASALIGLACFARFRRKPGETV